LPGRFGKWYMLRDPGRHAKDPTLRQGVVL